MGKNERNSTIAKEMRHHVASWQASKLNSQAYCADKDFTVHKLYYWFNKIKKSKSIQPTPEPALRVCSLKRSRPRLKAFPTFALPLMILYSGMTPWGLIPSRAGLFSNHLKEDLGQLHNIKSLIFNNLRRI